MMISSVVVMRDHHLRASLIPCASRCFRWLDILPLGGRTAFPDMPDDAARRAVDQFLLDEIDSVPHLEALLLLWRKRPHAWSLEEVARALYVRDEIAEVILRELESKRLAAKSEQCYIYNSDSTRDKLIEALDHIYRRELVRISTLIHSKASPSVRAFARAFRLKKD